MHGETVKFTGFLSIQVPFKTGLCCSTRRHTAAQRKHCCGYSKLSSPWSCNFKLPSWWMWPSCSPDFNPCDCVLCRFLKDDVSNKSYSRNRRCKKWNMHSHCKYWCRCWKMGRAKYPFACLSGYCGARWSYWGRSEIGWRSPSVIVTPAPEFLHFI